MDSICCQSPCKSPRPVCNKRKAMAKAAIFGTEEMNRVMATGAP